MSFAKAMGQHGVREGDIYDRLKENVTPDCLTRFMLHPRPSTESIGSLSGRHARQDGAPVPWKTQGSAALAR